VVEEIAVALLLDVTAARDDVERDATASDVVERGGLARRERGRHESRAVGDEIPEARRDRRGVGRHHEAVRAGRAVADQHAVEAAVLVHAREPRDELPVDIPGDDRLTVELGGERRRDHPDDFDSRAVQSSLLRRERVQPPRGVPRAATRRRT